MCQLSPEFVLEKLRPLLQDQLFHVFHQLRLSHVDHLRQSPQRVVELLILADGRLARTSRAGEAGAGFCIGRAYWHETAP